MTETEDFLAGAIVSTADAVVPGSGLLVDGVRKLLGRNDRLIREAIAEQQRDAVFELEDRIREIEAQAEMHGEKIERLEATQAELVFRKYVNVVARGAGLRKRRVLQNAAGNLQLPSFGDSATRVRLYDFLNGLPDPVFLTLSVLGNRSISVHSKRGLRLRIEGGHNQFAQERSGLAPADDAVLSETLRAHPELFDTTPNVSVEDEMGGYHAIVYKLTSLGAALHSFGAPWDVSSPAASPNG